MKQQGFTLIELIIVIVILGILAVTAAPRFIDIQSDARKEVLQGVKGAVQGASQLVYAKSAIAGVQKAPTSTVMLNTEDVSVRFGYPDASAIVAGGSITAETKLQRFVDVELTGDSQLVLDANVATQTFRIRYRSITTDANGDGCYMQYVSAAGLNATPVFSVNNEKC